MRGLNLLQSVARTDYAFYFTVLELEALKNPRLGRLVVRHPQSPSCALSNPITPGAHDLTLLHTLLLARPLALLFSVCVCVCE